MEKVVIRISDASPSLDCDSVPIMIFMPASRAPSRGTCKNNASSACNNNVNTFIGYRFRSTCAAASFITVYTVYVRDPD